MRRANASVGVTVTVCGLVCWGVREKKSRAVRDSADILQPQGPPRSRAEQARGESRAPRHRHASDRLLRVDID